MSDTAFGTLDESKDGLIVSFDQVRSKNFVLVTPDTLLDDSVEDNDISDVFIHNSNQRLVWVMLLWITSMEGRSSDGQNRTVRSLKCQLSQDRICPSI